MDTTYLGKGFGVMLFKDALTSENLLKYYVKHETNTLYIQGIKELQKRGFTVAAIVCDGRKGLVQAFGDIPVRFIKQQLFADILQKNQTSGWHGVVTSS
jgi:hypothetical protein